MIIIEISKAIEQSNFDWTSAISAFCSAISLIAIIILLIERSEKKRPYLQVSFELVRSNLVCLLIRNVGETPAKLREIQFNQTFIKQLPEMPKNKFKDKNNMNISIFPKQFWVLSFDVTTATILKYPITKLDITLKYSSIKKKKLYNEYETIDFLDYKGFLVYISETDELKKDIQKLNENLKNINHALINMTKVNTYISTEHFSSLEDEFNKKVKNDEEDL